MNTRIVLFAAILLSFAYISCALADHGPPHQIFSVFDPPAPVAGDLVTLEVFVSNCLGQGLSINEDGDQDYLVRQGSEFHVYLVVRSEPWICITGPPMPPFT